MGVCVFKCFLNVFLVHAVSARCWSFGVFEAGFFRAVFFFGRGSGQGVLRVLVFFRVRVFPGLGFFGGRVCSGLGWVSVPAHQKATQSPLSQASRACGHVGWDKSAERLLAMVPVTGHLWCGPRVREVPHSSTEGGLI